MGSNGRGSHHRRCLPPRLMLPRDFTMQPTPLPVTPAMTPAINRKALFFILFTGFLNLAGIGLIGPVASFLVTPYVRNPHLLAAATGLLFTAYSLCQFLAVPGLGAWSDHVGRKPVLLICLLGSAVGYLLLGVGGALWVLFLGRIIDGITGGSMGTIYAYLADITPPDQRTRYYGLVGAISGLGFVVGPALGGVLAKSGGPTAPAYFAAAATLLNVLWGWWTMPESLAPSRRTPTFQFYTLNPLTQLVGVFHLRELRPLLIATLLVQLPLAMMMSNLAVLGQQVLNWTPEQVAWVFAVVGGVGIIVQGGLIRLLIRWTGEFVLVIMGALVMAAGFGLFALVPVLQTNWVMYGGAAIFAVGNGMLTPALAGLISQTVGSQQQGRVQGGNQSFQALGRILGPTYGSAAYVGIGPGAPYWIGSLLYAAATLYILTAAPALRGTAQLRRG